MAPQVQDGRSARWEQHRRTRRQAIIAAAIVAISKHGPDATTSQIADVAGVPRTHVYRHFDDKRALDRAVSRYVAGQIGRQIRAALAAGGSPRTTISAAINEHLSWIEGHPNLYRFLAQHAYSVAETGSPSSDDAKAAFAGELTTLLTHYLTAFSLDPAPAGRVIVGVVAMVDSTASWWIEHHDVQRAELTEALTNQVWVIFDLTLRQLGLVLDPDQPLPRLTDGIG